jgi:hypothetical protein
VSSIVSFTYFKNKLQYSETLVLDGGHSRGKKKRVGGARVGVEVCVGIKSTLKRAYVIVN